MFLKCFPWLLFAFLPTNVKENSHSSVDMTHFPRKFWEGIQKAGISSPDMVSDWLPVFKLKTWN